MAARNESLNTFVGECVYDISERKKLELVREVYHRLSRVEHIDGSYACLAFDGRSPLGNLARWTELQGFATLGDTADDFHAQYGPYEGNSLFYVLFDMENGEPIGAARIISGAGGPLKTLVDMEALFAETGATQEAILRHMGVGDQRDVWDFATLSVRPEYRSDTASTGNIAHATLNRAVLSGMKNNHTRCITSVLDHRARRSLAMTGVEFNPLHPGIPAEGFPYVTSARSFAGYASVEDMMTRIRERRAKVQEVGSPYPAALTAAVDELYSGQYTDLITRYI